MTARLPSLNGLRAFEAAARHLSFTLAASELNVTQTAISHQIRRLEEELGIRLFVRQNRALALTPEARDYLPGASAPPSMTSALRPTGCCARTTTRC
ncbi:DNA-binding transcriptional LysR family regulator [Bradyrhizobium sp. i1.4.4]